MLTPSKAKLYDVVRQDQICPKCGGALQAQYRRGRKVLVCINQSWGDCDYQTDAPEDQQLRAQHAPTLPGFGNDQGGGLGGEA